MKKIFTLITVAALSIATATAQTGTYNNFQNLKALNPDGDMVAVGGIMTGVSPNGKYAVGSDWDYTYHSWIWQADGPTLLLAQPSAENIVLDVSNDGTAVGSFWDEEAQIVVPGYRTIDGTWHRLQQPDYAQTAYQEWKKGQYNEPALPYIPTAYFISGDGKHIGGWTYAGGGSSDTRPGFDAKLHGFFWHMNEAGEYELEDLADVSMKDTQQGFRPYAMNEEGTILAGLTQNDTGIFQPSAIVDGKLEIIIAATEGEYSDVMVKGTFEGSCFSVVGRTVYGYGDYNQVTEDENGDVISEIHTTSSFRYNVDTKKLDYLPNVYVKVANSDGFALAINKMGQLCVVQPDFETVRPVKTPVSFNEVNAASDDFMTLACLSQRYTDYGILNTPILITYTDSPIAAGISVVNANDNANDNIYNLAGQRLREMQRGINIVGGKKILK